MATKKTSTAVAVKKTGTGMVSIQDRIRALAEQNKDKIAPAGGNVIRIGQDKTITVPGQGEMNEVDLVIVDFLSTQNFYPDGFDPKNLVPPDCFAIGSNPQKLVPSPNSPNIQVDLKKGQGCNECKQFQWGSDPKGDGKACKSGRKLAVLPAQDDTPDSTPLMQLNVSPTGLKGFDGLVAGFNRIGTIPVAMAVHVDCNPAMKYPSLRFSNPQPNPHLEEHIDRLDEAKTLLSSEPDVTGWAEKKAGAKKSKPGARR